MNAAYLEEILRSDEPGIVYLYGPDFVDEESPQVTVRVLDESDDKACLVWYNLPGRYTSCNADQDYARGSYTMNHDVAALHQPEPEDEEDE